MLIVIGTLLPVIGSIATAILGAVLKNKARWISLFTIPIITLAICLAFSKEIAYNGNLLFAAIFLVYVILLPIYYLVLTSFLVVKWIKKRKTSNSS